MKSQPTDPSAAANTESVSFTTAPLSMDRAEEAIRAGRTLYWKFGSPTWDDGDEEDDHANA